MLNTGKLRKLSSIALARLPHSRKYIANSDNVSVTEDVRDTARTGALEFRAAILAIAFAVSTNTISKAVAAFASGGWNYGRALLPGLALMLIAMWGGVWLAETT